MKKGGLVWFVGLLAFIVVFAAGFAFFFRWFPQFSDALNTIKNPMMKCYKDKQ